jgi:hypothetical protein
MTWDDEVVFSARGLRHNRQAVRRYLYLKNINV